MNADKTTYHVRMPASLCQESIKGAVGVGLFYMSLGRRPATIPTGARTKTRIRVSGRAAQYLQQAAAAFGSVNAALVAAAAFVAERPHIQKTII